MAHMESAQVVKVFDNQQAFTDELKEVEAKAQLNLVAIGTLNGTAKLLSRREMHFWRGVSFTLPDVPANTGMVTHISDSSPGVKFGVEFYYGPDSTNASKFVIAVDMLNSKIYVTNGPVGPTDWNVVEVELDKSGYEIEYNDPKLGVMVLANVNRTGATMTFMKFMN